MMKNMPKILCHKKMIVPGSIDKAVDPYGTLMACWLIEMALCLGWYRKTSIGRLPNIFIDEDFINFTGIHIPMRKDECDDMVPSQSFVSKLTDARAAKLLEKRLVELQAIPLSVDLPLFCNIEILGRLLGLSEADQTVLAFAVVLSAFDKFKTAFLALNETVSHDRIAKIIAAISGQPEIDIRKSLHEDSPLLSAGIIKVEPGSVDLERKIDLMERLGEILLQQHADEDVLVGQFLKPASPPTLDITDFPHLARDIDALSAYLGNAIQSREPGVNTLFYGPPGTGKTELVKVLAAKLGLDLFEISFSDDSGNPIKGNERLRAYNLCQKIVAHRPNTLLMFDEIEDVFENYGFLALLFGGDKKEMAKGGGKAWINRTLERNSTAAIWITNNQDIDSAYLRRFDYSVRFPIPPQAVRKEIARHHFGQFEPAERWLCGVAANEVASPAQLERAARVARIACNGDKTRALELVEQVLDRSATLLDQKRTPPRNVLRTGYDLGFINTDIDIQKVVAGLKRKPRGTFCFFGPAGTGKSELGRYLADEIGKPVLLRRASDILSMWVGESEKNIARMFDDARQQEAVLILDEADSFLADRRNARASWEVTQVNELLTQMEAFEGIFICTTNLMQKLDQASLRRFGFKVKFDFLKPDQRWDMFARELGRYGSDLDAASEWEPLVRRIDQLTPGDFAVVARQYELWSTVPTAGELYEQLHRECIAKGALGRSIGFTT